MSDLLSAASLLLAVVGVLYGLWYGEISRALETKVPTHAADRVKPRNAVERTFRTRAVPISLASLTVGLVFLPSAIGIVWESMQGYAGEGLAFLKAYDPIRTALCLVVAFSLALAGHSAVRLTRLVALVRRLSATN